MLGQLRRGSPDLDLRAPRVASFPTLHGPVSGPLPPLAQTWHPRKSRLETKTDNEASSALLALLWCHLPLQNPANRAKNLTRLFSATIGRTVWRMVQFGAIRSRPKGVFSVYSVSPPLFRRAGSAAM